ncbi:hypothetical protein L1068_11285 [Pseudoalteromonas sp. MMG023]|nr:hypothetical protein [Pseudoalteromonas sp. MMG024]
MDGLNWQYEEIDVTHNSHEFKQMVLLSGRKTVPQIFIDGEHISGCDDFKAYLTSRVMCNGAAILASFALANIVVFVFIEYLTDDLFLVGLDLARSQFRLNIK